MMRHVCLGAEVRGRVTQLAATPPIAPLLCLFHIQLAATRPIGPLLCAFLLGSKGDEG